MGCDVGNDAKIIPPPLFQYPRTDRMGCDNGVIAPELVQAFAFSILERIEWAATAESAQGQERRNAAFSILERIEWAATDYLASEQRWLSLFQYPRTDRMGCDL